MIEIALTLIALFVTALIIIGIFNIKLTKDKTNKESKPYQPKPSVKGLMAIADYEIDILILMEKRGAISRIQYNNTIDILIADLLERIDEVELTKTR